jgi:hypothetical protein
MLDIRSNRKYPIFRPGQYETFYGKLSPDSQWVIFLTDIDGKHRVHAAPFRGTLGDHPKPAIHNHLKTGQR